MPDSVFELEITDPHHHLWDLDAHHYPWLTDSYNARVCGEYSAIRKSYLLENLQADIGKLNVTKTVHIEAVIEPSQIVQETAWLQSIADSDSYCGIPNGIVASAHFLDENIEDILEQHSQYTNFRGIREHVHDGWIDPENPTPTKLQDPAWREAVGLCQKFGIHFELQIYPQQVEEAIELLKLHPDLPVVLNHTGFPRVTNNEDKTQWRETINRLSAFDNLHVKISGFGMFDRNWSAESVRPLILDTINTFGMDRCMFATNFPVDSLACSYLEIWTRYFEATADFSDTDREKLFSINANQFYRLA